MNEPVAMRILQGDAVEVHRVTINPTLAKGLRPSSHRFGPAIIVVREISVVPAQSAGLLDTSSIIGVVDGDWSNAILVVAPSSEEENKAFAVPRGDEAFLNSVASGSPGLSNLAQKTVEALRAGGVDGELIQDKSGRWVNRPINMLTLKAQPRAGNLAFTIYGSPDAFDAGEFLRRDQNSYSRGWISSEDDIDQLVRLAKLSQARRLG